MFCDVNVSCRARSMVCYIYFKLNITRHINNTGPANDSLIDFQINNRQCCNIINSPIIIGSVGIVIIASNAYKIIEYTRIFDFGNNSHVYGFTCIHITNNPSIITIVNTVISGIVGYKFKVIKVKRFSYNDS